MRTRRARRILTGASLLVCALFAGSCRAVLGTDDYEPSVGALCGLLIRCFQGTIVEGCDERVAAELTDAAPIQRETWLRTFSDASCLESCASARRCLNIAPVCNLSECKVREECCGFVEGRADCNALNGACCAPRGVDCVSDEQCCAGAGPCDAITGTCGGVICRPPGEACTQSDQCCTKVCRNDVCGEDLCHDNGLECQDNDQCCSGFCNVAKGKCSDPPCLKEGEGCVPGGNPCCGTLECELGSAGKSECVSTCHDDGLECSSDGQCCSGRCDLTLTACVSCALPGDPCSLGAECCNGSCTDGACPVCELKGATCEENADCCSGACGQGDADPEKECVPVCNAPGCAHDECAVGGPLLRTCTECDGGGCQINPACVDRVCDEDPYCCCKQWDPLCAAKAAGLCKDLTNPKACD